MAFKKLMRISGLLLVSFNFFLASVNSADPDPIQLPTCTYNDESKKCQVNTDPLGQHKYCITAEGQIYYNEDDASGGCELQFGDKNYDEGLKVFHIVEKNAIVDLSTSTLEPGANTVVLYDCAYGKCVQTFGYVIIGNAAYSCTPTSSSAYTTSNNECTVDNIGKVNFTGDGELQVCVLSGTTVSNQTPTNSVGFKIASDNKYYSLRSADFSDGTFASSNDYNNIALLKTTDKSVVFAKRSPQLPICDSSCKVGAVAIAENSVCQGSNGAIYKKSGGCTKIYGKSDGTGIKVFQKVSNFNDYKDVTGSLDKVSANAAATPGQTDEITPYLVIYDCSTTTCRQTGGFVKYKAENDKVYGFMNCYSPNDPKVVVGSIPMNVDTSESVEGHSDDDIACNENKAKVGTYKFTNFNNEGIAKYEMCLYPTVNGESDNPYFINMNINKNENTVFSFTNGNTAFTGVDANAKVFLKINNYAATFALEVTKGYYVNSGSVYTEDADKGKDALIYCSETGTDLSKCDVLPAPSGYYLNAGPDKATRQVIRCLNQVCASEAVTKTDCNSQVVGGLIVSSGKVKICLSKTESIDLVEDATATLPKYKTISLALPNDFPGGEKGSIDIKISPDGSARLLSDLSLPRCEQISDGSAVCISGPDGYCIYDDKIYFSVTGSPACTLTYGDNDFDDGIKAFDVNTGAVISDISTVTKDKTVVLYNCAYGKCVQVNGYIYTKTLAFECRKNDFLDVTESAKTSECKTIADQGNIKYTAYVAAAKEADVVDTKVEICSTKTVSVSASPSVSVEFKSVDVNSFMQIQNSIVPESGTFAGKTYNNVGLIKSAKNVVALSNTGIRLPNCGDASNCKYNGRDDIATNEYCIYRDKIYKKSAKGCDLTYGDTGKVGIKIFKRGDNFVKYTLEDTFTGLTANPDFVIYDCSESECVQTSGYIKYEDTGEVNTTHIRSCSALGCKDLIEDTSTDKTCNEAKASLGFFTFGSNILKVCVSTRVGEVNSYKYVTLDLTKTGKFLYTNGAIPFPGSESEKNVLLDVTSNYVISSNTISAGDHINIQSIYSSTDTSNKGKDAIVSCETENDIDSCFVRSAPSNTVDVYVNADITNNNPLIICEDAGCTAEEDNGYENPSVAAIDASDKNKKSIITCNTKTDCSSVNKYEDLLLNDLYFIDGNDNKKIITCNNENGCSTVDKCTSLSGTAELYFIDGTKTTNKIIKCDHSNECSVVDISPGTGIATYIDGSDSSRTITCVNMASCVSTKIVTACSSTEGQCKYGSTNTPLDDNKYCMMENKIYLAKTNTCTIAYGTTDKSGDVLLTESTNGYALGTFGRDFGLIYKCDATSCTQIKSVYYLYVTSNVRYMYKCDDSGYCISVNKPKPGYYVSGIPSSGQYTEVIRCTTDEVSSCKTSRVDDDDDELTIPTGYFINLINTKYLANCTGVNCTLELGLTTQGYGYLDQSQETLTGTPVTKYVITCNSDGCTSILGNTTEGSAYIDASDQDNIIVCNENKCSNPEAASHIAVEYYIDATNPNYTITWPHPTGDCSTEKECRVNTGVGCEDKTYYLVKDKTLFIQKGVTTGYLYYCTKNEGEISCKEVYAKGYYINSKDLIYKCNGTSGGCSVETVEPNHVVGKIDILNDISMYLKGSISVKLASPPRNYLVETGDDGVDTYGTDATNTSAIVTVDENSVTLNTNYSFDQDYIYVNSVTQEVLDKDICPSKGFVVVQEYKCDMTNSICQVVPPAAEPPAAEPPAAEPPAAEP